VARCTALILLEASDAAHPSNPATNGPSRLLSQSMLLKLLRILRLGILRLLLDLLLQLVAHKGILTSILVA